MPLLSQRLIVKVLSKPPWDGRLDFQDRDPFRCPRLMAWPSARQGTPIEAHELEVVAEPLVIVQHVLEHHTGIDDIGGIGCLSLFLIPA